MWAQQSDLTLLGDNNFYNIYSTREKQEWEPNWKHKKTTFSSSSALFTFDLIFARIKKHWFLFPRDFFYRRFFFASVAN